MTQPDDNPRPVITVWTKPACVQCTAVKRRLVEKIAGKTGLSGAQLVDEFGALVDAGHVDEQDLTHPDNAKHLEYFRGLGYSSAPITEFRVHLLAGFVPAEVDRIVEAWRAAGVLA